mgnify:CR=1 FL=1
MITLHDLINCDLMGKNHHVYFHFKSYYFKGTISELGCIYETYCDDNQVFHERNPFDSISEWADACIQELCNEYVTRFSAWKRISHQESGLTLYTLRQMYNQFANGKVPITNQTITTMRQYLTSTIVYIETLEKQIASLQNYIDGSSSVINYKIVQRPMALKQLTVMHNTYLQENN